jgi:intracellular multiplication protein IcmL
MAHDALEVVKLKRNFYRDSYRLVVVALLVALLIIAGLVGTVYYQLTHKPTPQYFATTSDGKLIPMIPMDQPNLSDHSLLLWVENAVTSLYTFDFLNFRQTFQSDSQYFTKAGWSAYLDQLQASRNMDAVQSKKLTVRAVPSGAPVILSQANIDGVYSWRVQIPILVTYESLSETFNQSLLVTLVIRRLSTLSSKYGIGISQFVAAQQ